MHSWQYLTEHCRDVLANFVDWYESSFVCSRCYGTGLKPELFRVAELWKVIDGKDQHVRIEKLNDVATIHMLLTETGICLVHVENNTRICFLVVTVHGWQFLFSRRSDLNSFNAMFDWSSQQYTLVAL